MGEHSRMNISKQPWSYNVKEDDYMGQYNSKGCYWLKNDKTLVVINITKETVYSTILKNEKIQFNCPESKA